MRDAILTLVLLGIAAVAALYFFGRNGYSTRVAPNAAEEFIALRVRDLATPADAKEQVNPYGNEPNAWRQAVAHFEDHCAMCHGSDGRGRSEIGKNLYPKAPDMTRPRTQGLSDGELYYIIDNGVRFTGMPGWGGEDSPEEMWKLVSFIRHLPNYTAEEMEEIQGAGQGGQEPAEEHEHNEGEAKGKPPAGSAPPKHEHKE
ncbi:MAG: cytochrome c [Acidobacteria bacterium]|nr:cytochrome c [Acidobacteriota bacterium]